MPHSNSKPGVMLKTATDEIWLAGDVDILATEDGGVQLIRVGGPVLLAAAPGQWCYALRTGADGEVDRAEAQPA